MRQFMITIFICTFVFLWGCGTNSSDKPIVEKNTESTADAPLGTPSDSPGGQPAPAVAPSDKPEEPVSTESLKAPKSFGVATCDQYAERVCSCADTDFRQQKCAEVHKMFDLWRRIASKPQMRSFVAEGCKGELNAAAQVCP